MRANHILTMDFSVQRNHGNDRHASKEEKNSRQ